MDMHIFKNQLLSLCAAFFSISAYAMTVITPQDIQRIQELITKQSPKTNEEFEATLSTIPDAVRQRFRDQTKFKSLADLTVASPETRRAIFNAALFGRNPDTVVLDFIFLAARNGGQELLNSTDNMHYTFLHKAATDRRADVVKALKEVAEKYGAVLDANRILPKVEQEPQASALWLAVAKYPSIDVVRELVSIPGINFTEYFFENCVYDTVLTRAIIQRMPEFVRLTATRNNVNIPRVAGAGPGCAGQQRVEQRPLQLAQTVNMPQDIIDYLKTLGAQ